MERQALFLLIAVLSVVVQNASAFSRPLPLRMVDHQRTIATATTVRLTTTVLYSQLQEKTVKDLWQIVEDAGGVERGLKTRLKRKQDIIEYIESRSEIILESNCANDAVDTKAEEHHETPPLAPPAKKYEKDKKITKVKDEVKATEKTEDLTIILEASATDGGEHDAPPAAIKGEKREVKIRSVKDEKETAEKVEDQTTKSEASNTPEQQPFPEVLDLHPDIASKIPLFLAEKMVRRDITSLLPIQAKSFERIFNGEDAVLQSPTGSGKTLAFVLPIVARKYKGARRQYQAAPFVLVLAPARELARQVGREFDKFSKGSSAAVFGGVPVERHVALLKSKPQVLVSTPGRLRELVREGHLDYSQIRTVVIDEADTLLDKADSPDVRAILEDLEKAVSERGEDAEYQLVLVSATMNENVLQFTRDMEIPPKAKIRVQGGESRELVTTTKVPSASIEDDDDAPEVDAMDRETAQTTPKQPQPSVQAVNHWHMSCKSSVRTSVATDLISILMPSLTIIFVNTKAEAEGVASTLSTKLGNGVVRVLHGDMAQSSRSRTMALVRESALTGDSQVLVATDVASRGIDLWVDLVIQFGVPRLTGKEGTFSAELYTHRTGRTGRVRATQSKGVVKPSNTVMLYDPASGEGKNIRHLAKEVQDELGVVMLPKQLPSAAEVVAAGYDRAKRSINLGDNRPDKSDLVSYFRSVLETEEGVDTSNPQELLEYFSRSMALLSKLDPSVSPFEQHASLLSGDSSDRTLRFYRTSGEAVSPPEVTKTCKQLGSGKLGRVLICEDSSAVFDLSTKRATKLLEAFQAADDDYQLEIPLALSDLPNV